VTSYQNWISELPLEKERIDYNEHRPHSALGDLTPREFVDRAAKTGLQEGANFQCSAV
jgi:hypothetical protein